MRYKDVANGLVATPALSFDTHATFGAVSVPVVAPGSISTSMLSVPSVVFLSTVNVGVATGLLVTYLYSTVSPRKAVSLPQGRGYRHIYFPK